MSEPKDIWQPQEGGLPEEKLLAYLEGRLTPEEQHEVEQWLAAEGMESDALEGLKEINPEESKRMVNQVNYHLRGELAGKKRRTRQIADNQWAWVAVLVVLLLAVLGYVVIRMMVNR